MIALYEATGVRLLLYWIGYEEGGLGLGRRKEEKKVVRSFFYMLFME